MKTKTFGYDRRGNKTSPPIVKGTIMNDMVVGRIESLSNDFPRIPQISGKDLFLEWLMNYKGDLTIKKDKAIKEKQGNPASYLIEKILTCIEIERAYRKLK